MVVVNHVMDIIVNHCQPITQNVDFSGYDQIQNPQYPDIHEKPLTNDKFEAYTIANDANMNDLQFKLDNLQQDFQKKFEQKRDDFLNQMRNFMQNFHDGPPIPPPGEDKEHEPTTDTEVVHKSSISSNTSQISSIYSIAPVLSTKEPKHLLSMGYEHLSITPKTEFDEVTESNAEILLPIPSKCEVTLEDKKECDFPFCENYFVCDKFDTFSDSKIDDDISDYDDDFEDIEYIKASLFDLEIETLINLMKNDIPDNSSNDPLLEEVDLFLSDNSIPPGNPSIPRPPPKPPDAETNAGEEIPVAMNDKDEFDNDDYSSFMFVIFAKEFSLLSAESEDTIFDPGIFD
uniref:Reverse transcriptase domain-containing protein n=1 Tax=Tanacetum cinerariifolium TaxID=118510 RepID=A0A699JDP1_TANCI|nr:hypothetical protein [Tanacetum cinerariifolium]